MTPRPSTRQLQRAAEAVAALQVILERPELRRAVADLDSADLARRLRARGELAAAEDDDRELLRRIGLRLWPRERAA